MAQLLEHFERYVKAGWRVIPVHPRTKKPVGLWTSRYREGKARDFISQNPRYNIGILLGNGIVDVEGDTPEANRLIEDAVAGVPHPCYRSSKSTHHLFACPDNSLTIVRALGVEFRGNRHFSVLPPSRHSTGAEYRWIREPERDLPLMPLPLLRLYAEHAPQPPKEPPARCENPACAACGKSFFVPKDRFRLELEAFRKHGRRWSCHACRLIDVRGICRFLKIRERGRPT